MRHAKPEDLIQISDLLASVRRITNIKERTPCHFYFKGVNVLHFHIDGERLFADVGTMRIDVSKENGETVLRAVLDLVSEIK